MNENSIIQYSFLAGHLDRHPKDYIVYLQESKVYQLYSEKEEMIIPLLEVSYDSIKLLMRVGILEFVDGIFQTSFRDEADSG